MQTVDDAVSAASTSREWVHRGVRMMIEDKRTSIEPPLIRFDLPASWGVSLFFKNEAAQPTGSLKHRLARSLFLYALCNGLVSEGTTIVEASSGSTAVSEAHFARMLGLPFIAVVPRSTSSEKVKLIEAQGARCHFVDDPTAIYETAQELARSTHGYYMDQFTYAERATEWATKENIAAATLAQLKAERISDPEWMVIGAGTGGTSATIGRYLRLSAARTRLCVVDPESSAFFPAWKSGDRSTTGGGSRIEGIGRPRVEPSFVPTVIDHMFQVPDSASMAAMLAFHEVTGVQAGASTGTNLWGALQLVSGMRAAGIEGSVVSFICDGGERYQDSYYDAEWRRQRGLNATENHGELRRFLASDGHGFGDRTALPSDLQRSNPS